MAVSVMVGATNKRINSTSQTFSSSTNLSCRLKEPTSMQNPVFIVQGLSKTTLYNFAKFMNNYYWVDDVVYKTNDIQEIHCHLDPLATFKGAIENSYALVQYGDEGHWNKWIDDLRFSPEYEADNQDSTENIIPGLTTAAGGYVVMRYMDCGNGGGVKTCAMTLSQFWDMLEDLSGIINASTTVGEIVAKIGGLGSWRDNILSCIYIPSTSAGGGTAIGSIRLGGVTCTGTFYEVGAIKIAPASGSFSTSFIWSQIETSNEYFRKNDRWVSIQITTPFGYVDIPVELLKNQQNIYFTSTLDCITGDVTIKFTDKADGLGVCYGAFTGNIGVDMMDMCGNGKDFKGGMANAIQYGAKLGATAATLGASMGSSAISAQRAVMADANSSEDTFEGYMQKAKQAKSAGAQASSLSMASGIDSVASCVPSGISFGFGSGGVGTGFSSLFLTTPNGQAVFSARIFNKALGSYKDYCAMYGYPCNQYLKLSSIAAGSFIKCSGASVQGALYASEANKSTINSYLNSGFYLEA